MMSTRTILASVAALIFTGAEPASAQGLLQLPNIFGDDMVLQRDQPLHFWGRAKPGENVRVRIAPRDLTVRADAEGKWSMELEALPASSQAKSLLVESAGERVELDNIVLGDVWLLGGQSNMEDVLESIYHGDVEMASANFPNIRLMTIPTAASPVPLEDIDRINEFNAWTGQHEAKGSWVQCTPRSVRRFSAIGYVFGRRLHMVSGVPIGLVDASVGGTTVEGWVTRDKLATIPGCAGLIAEWDEEIAAYDPVASLAARVENWERDTKRRAERGEEPNPKPTEPDLDPAHNRSNPGASYNSMIAPIGGFRIKGAIFNQGYNNALGNARPALYGETFRAMIEDWRATFGDEALPFGVLGLTAGGEPQTLENFELRMVDAGPYIREAQHRAALALDGVCFMPSYDQQVPWYHPHKKLQLGERIARWALHTQYSQEQIRWRPVELAEQQVEGDHIVLRFHGPVRAHDGRPFVGFAIAGENRHFVPAEAAFVVTGHDQHNRPQYDEKRVRVSSPLVLNPVAVRYAWARNPLCNVVNSGHHERIIPIPSFRTDDWDWPEAPFRGAQGDAENLHREAVRRLRDAAKENLAWRLGQEGGGEGSD